MQRLKDKLAGKPFTILGVNMAEEPGEVRDFLSKIVHVDFPILLDRDGAALGRWKVFAFPTNYVVDKRGRIRYAMFGAIDWDNPDVVTKIEGLLAE
jgi:peroxiredoxin